LIHAVHGAFYTQPLLLADFKDNKYIQKRETRKLLSIREWLFVEWEKLSLRRLQFMPRNLDKKCQSRIPSLDSFFLVLIATSVFFTIIFVILHFVLV